MRKGRSSRRSRVSRPNLGTKTNQNVEAHSAAPAPNVNVVIGVTAPLDATASSPARIEAESPSTQNTAAARVSAVTRALDVAGEEPHEPEPASIERLKVDEAEEAAPPDSVAAVIDQLEKLEAKVENGAPVAAAEAIDREDTVDDPELPEKIEEKIAAQIETPLAEDTIYDHELDAKIAEKVEATGAAAAEAEAEAEAAAEEEEEEEEEAQAKEEARADEKREAIAEADVTPAVAAVTPIDEESIPPIGDLAVHETFFSQGDVSALAGDDDLDEAAADKLKRKAAPEVVQRRARFVRYVTWAVGVSAALCLVAGVRTVLAPSAKTLTAPAHAAVMVDAPVTKAAAPPAEIAQPAQPVAPAVAAAPAATVAAAEPEAPKAEEPATPIVTGDAKEEKATAKKALERGKIAEAIAAGERAVALDEEDGEAWLLLGAAYQEKGRLADARKAYTACVKQGKKGPRHECAQMLR